MSDIGQVISQQLIQYVTELKAGKVANNQSSWPDLQAFDTFFFNKNTSGQERCEAIRVQFTGVIVDDKGLESYISKLSKLEMTTQTGSDIPDIDGDGKAEFQDNYALEPMLQPPILKQGVLCFQSKWIAEYTYQPFLSVVHFSKGGHAVVTSTVYDVKAKAITPFLLP